MDCKKFYIKFLENFTDAKFELYSMCRDIDPNGVFESRMHQRNTGFRIKK